MSSRRFLVPALLLATSLHCHGRKSGSSDDAKTNDPSKPFVAEKGDVVLAPVERAQELLPLDTQLLFEAKSLARAAEVFQREKVAKEAPKIYGEIEKELVQVFGVDILVPANLPAIGVDPNGAVGVALLDAKSEAVAVWAKVTDPGKFREVAIAAASRAGTQLAPLSLGGAEILKDQNGRAAVVLREPFAVLVMSRPPAEGKEDIDWARAIATMDPSQSLGGSAKFRKVTAGWVDTDALVYGDLSAVVASLVSDENYEDMFSNKWAEDQLAEARRNGAAPEEIARLEAQVKQAAEDNKRWVAREKAQRELAAFVFGGLSTLAMRIDVKRGGPVIEGRVQQAGDAFPRSLVRNQEAAAPLTWALDGMPIVLAAGAVEVDAFIDLVDRAARTDSQSWKTLVKELEKETGVDINAEIRPLLTGVAGGAVTIDSDLSKATPKTMQKLLGFHVHAEVSDPAKIEAALSKALPKLDIDGHKFKKERDGGWSTEVEKFRKVHIKVAGKHVVVSTDPGLAARLASGKAGTIGSRMRPAAAYGALSMKGQAFAWAQNFGAFAGLFFLGFSSMSGPMSTGDKPLTRTARRKQAELDKLGKQVDAQRELVEAQEMKKMFAAVEPFGSTVLVAREDKDGFIVQGGQFIRAKGLGDLIIHASKMFSGFEETPERKKLNELQSRFFQLQEELRQLQVTDAAKPQKRR